jgi:glycosyltransferase involved in cell wall biosynthesis
MARGLFALGHTVHVVAHGRRSQTTFADGAYVHRVPLARHRYDGLRGTPTLYPWLCHSHAAYERIRELMRNDGIEVLDSPLWHLDGLVASTQRLLPMVVRLQTAYTQIAAIQHGRDRDRRVIGELEADLLRRADHVVANTQATLDGARAMYRLDATAPPASIVAHGIEPVDDVDVRPFDAEGGRTARSVLYVGRLERRKGILDLFAAIPEVLRRVPDARFLVAGADNSASDGFERRTGRRYDEFFEERHPEAAHAVSFLGHVSEARLAQLYQSCDLFVAPSLHESFGLIYLEAMNYAKPVVACRAGGVPEVVAHGETGILVDPESPKALAEAIVTLLGSPTRLREMGLAGRARLLERFTHLAMARAFAEIYRSLVSRDAASGA